MTNSTITLIKDFELEINGLCSKKQTNIMIQTTGMVRGGIVIYKTLIDSKPNLKNVEPDTSYLGSEMKKYLHQLY